MCIAFSNLDCNPVGYNEGTEKLGNLPKVTQTVVELRF